MLTSALKLINFSQKLHPLKMSTQDLINGKDFLLRFLGFGKGGVDIATRGGERFYKYTRPERDIRIYATMTDIGKI